jgi:hypothetical protein
MNYLLTIIILKTKACKWRLSKSLEPTLESGYNLFNIEKVGCERKGASKRKIKMDDGI